MEIWLQVFLFWGFVTGFPNRFSILTQPREKENKRRLIFNSIVDLFLI